MSGSRAGAGDCWRHPDCGRWALELALEGRTAGVAEGVVALADGLPESGLRGTSLEGVALRGVPGDPVEDRPEHLCRVKALRVEGLVDEQLHHHQLVDRQAGDAM